MKPRFYNSPRIQKWSLFAGLVLALGFNLSWNPQLATLARNEMHQIDLAQSKPPEGAVNKEDPNLMDKVLNLGEYVQDERLGKYGVVLTVDVSGKNISYLIKKKTPEGYSTEGCDECLRKSISAPAQFQVTNVNHIKAVIADIVQANQKILLEAAKKIAETTKKDEGKKEEAGKGKSLFAEKCRNEADENIIDCQYSEIKSAQDDCKKYDATCDKKIKAMFKPIENLFKACSGNKASSRSRVRDEEDVDCDAARDLAEDVLGDIRSDYVLKKSAGFLQSTVTDGSAKLRDRLIKNHVDPLVGADLLKGDYDRHAGTYTVMVPQYDANGKFVKMVESVSELPARNTYGSKVLSALASNDKFRNQEAAVDFFKSNFYDNLAQTRTAFFKNPMGFAYPTIDLDNNSFELMPPDLSKYRVNNYRGANAVPAAPQIAPAPAYATPAGPTAQPATPTTGFQPAAQQLAPLRSPYQRTQ